MRNTAHQVHPSPLVLTLGPKPTRRAPDLQAQSAQAAEVTESAAQQLIQGEDEEDEVTVPRPSHGIYTHIGVVEKW